MNNFAAKFIIILFQNDFNAYFAEIKDGYADYHNYCLEEQSSVSESVKYNYKKLLSGDIDISERIKIHSGVPALSSAIQEYIKSYAYPIKVRQLLNCFKLQTFSQNVHQKSFLLHSAQTASL